MGGEEVGGGRRGEWGVRKWRGGREKAGKEKEKGSGNRSREKCEVCEVVKIERATARATHVHHLTCYNGSIKSAVGHVFNSMYLLLHYTQLCSPGDVREKNFQNQLMYIHTHVGPGFSPGLLTWPSL